MTDKSISTAITHNANAMAVLESACSNLYSALHNISLAADAAKGANAHVSDEDSEALVRRMEAAKGARGAVVSACGELEAIYRNLREHNESLRGETD